MRKERKKTRHSKRRIVTIVMIVLLLGAAVLFVLEKTNTTSFFSFTNEDKASEAHTTSDLPSARPDYNGGAAAEENKDPGNTINENQGSAVIKDGNGAPSSDTSNPIKSSTGEITVYLPHANSSLATGQEISGTSSLSSVQYRLIDSVSGVIATGTLKVVNGNFSGNLSFNTSANEGRLDIFATRADASEFSNVEIPVRFK